MSTIVDTEKIDLISSDENKRLVTFFMMEPRDWDSDPDMYSQLQSKLNNYLTYIEDGQMLEDRPEFEGMKIVIHIDCTSNPMESAQASKIFRKIESILSERGLYFSFSIIDL